MKAVWYDRNGGSDVLTYGDLPTPTPGPTSTAGTTSGGAGGNGGTSAGATPAARRWKATRTTASAT